MTVSPTEVLQLRKVPITVEAGRVAATAWQAGVGGVHVLGARLRGRPVAAVAAHQARDRFAALGPTYVKLGQLIASSPGLFPEVLSNEFRTLLDKVPPADPAAVRELVTDQLGAPPEDVFATFDEVPIASASIAQVHHATLKSGERVVVKIQRPGIKARLAADMQILERVAAVLQLSSYGRMLNAKEVVADFAANLHDELDFHTEARAMEEWTACLADTQFASKVRAPKVYWEYTTGRVLVMEFIDAVRIDDVAAVRAAGHDGVELLRTLLLSLLESAFRGGVFHGDLHAGNVLVDTSGRIVFLDFGIVGRFDDRTRVILRQLLVDLMIRNDFESAGRALFRLGAVRRGREGSADDLRTFAAPLRRTQLGKVSYTQLGKQLADLAKAYDAKLPRELVLVGKQLLYVERYMKLLAPRWRALNDREVVNYVGGLVIQAEKERNAANKSRA
ncbi:AarF/ABC1/UbiB kinase family protein [Skermania sp. ID1734]|uniref:ABC1 kinase family protein n=1 Tax=Skermania sp. ID1734 TaxID=2597516 RepID=UPI00117D59B4|nr:AarF/UbiB family protein [Skermania sp. ID1734]TSD95114.1 AarF/ABC1/UbiB kinase family protein [Skermania sp. ID1734]